MEEFITISNLGAFGRLGNQLFQVAAALGYHSLTNKPILLPEWYCTYTKKNISQFFKNKINQNVPVGFPTVKYKEPFFHYTKISSSGCTDLYGYFQSYKYFEHCNDLIKYYFTPSDAISNKLNSKYGELLKTETCSVHIRRGDYVSSSTHDTCDINYYNRAIEYIKCKKVIDNFIIFSDDINWCKTQFPSNFIFIENNLNEIGSGSIHRENNSDIEELFLMSMCKNNIISNSSFSWWGAKLSEYLDNSSKIIVAPEKWFGETCKHNIADLIPLNWKKL